MKRVANTRRVYRQELLELKTILELLSSWASPEGVLSEAMPYFSRSFLC